MKLFSILTLLAVTAAIPFACSSPALVSHDVSKGTGYKGLKAPRHDEGKTPPGMAQHYNDLVQRKECSCFSNKMRGDERSNCGGGSPPPFNQKRSEHTESSFENVYPEPARNNDNYYDDYDKLEQDNGKLVVHKLKLTPSDLNYCENVAIQAFSGISREDAKKVCMDAIAALSGTVGDRMMTASGLMLGLACALAASAMSAL